MVAVIDLDSILFAAAWPNKIPDGFGGYIKEDGRFVYEDKTEEEIKHSLDTLMRNILNATNASGYIAFVKNKKTGVHRYNINSDYKSNRPKEIPKWWEFTKEYAINHWKAYPVDFLEADDAVNITRLGIKDSFIVAVDKDLLNLEGKHFNWRTFEWVEVSNEDAYNYFWADMIIGQPGDGLLGVPGKGKVYASKMDLTPYSVLKEYIKYFGEDQGIHKYYQTYACLKILDKYDDFTIPEIIDITWERELI